MSWSISAVPLPDGDAVADLWVDDSGLLANAPIADAERLPGRFAAPGLVDAHAHPSVTARDGPGSRTPDEAVDTLTGWARSGVGLVRDVGSPGGMTLELDLRPGLPRVQAAGRFLAPSGHYFPELLRAGVPAEELVDAGLAELARGARWVKVIADFPVVRDGVPTGPSEPTYPMEAVSRLIDAVHAAGARVAAHTNTSILPDLVAAGLDSVEHGALMDEATLRHMAQTGAAWTPTLSAMFGAFDAMSDEQRARVEPMRERVLTMLRLADQLGITILAGTDVVGTMPQEIALLAGAGLSPHAALAAATTSAYDFLGEPHGQVGRPATVVTYDEDPREDIDVLSNPRAVLIDGVRVA